LCYFITLTLNNFIIYPLATLKILGIVAIVSRKVEVITEWAYAGFFFNLLLAFGAHYFGGDNFVVPLVAIVLLFTSYFLGKKIRINKP